MSGQEPAPRRVATLGLCAQAPLDIQCGLQDSSSTKGGNHGYRAARLSKDDRQSHHGRRSYARARRQNSRRQRSRPRRHLRRPRPRRRSHPRLFARPREQKSSPSATSTKTSPTSASPKSRRSACPSRNPYVDIRKLLEDKDIDAISIATPNHWHSLMAIWACQAGKDVYVEKPCSHNTFEGRQLVRAVKKYNRICQHGSQSRSNPGMIEAIQSSERRHHRRCLHGSRALLTSGAHRSATLRRNPFPPASITISGPAPRRSSLSRAIAFTTTGTGSGTPATVKSATKPSTKSISLAGA